jgi:hypothetical protein
MERAQSDEFGQRCGGTVPILGARHEHKCRLGGDWEILETKKATANAVRVRPREERSEETATHNLFPA